MPAAPRPKPTAKQRSGKARPVKRKSGGAIVNALILIVLTAFIWIFREYNAKIKSENHMNGLNLGEVYPHYDTPPGTPVMTVLFVGNSYTLVNRMPFMVQAIAASDTVHPVVINPYMFGKGGATLEDLWEEPASLESLGSQHWDYVVLQEQSTMATDADWVNQMHQGIVNWDRSIKKLGSRTILYETWAKKAGSDWYDRRKNPDLDLVNPDVMQQKLDQAYNGFASEIGASLVPVGDYWAMCEQQTGMPDFFNKDGSHPNFAGDYLISLLFYRALTGHKLDHVTFVPPEVSPEQAEAIRTCASYGG